MHALVPIVAQAASPPQGQTGLLTFMPIILIFVIFYFIMWRPQMRRQKEHDKMIEALRPKDKVILNSGMYATVVKVVDNDIIVEVADKVHLKFQRSAVAAVRNKSDKPADEAS